jgi:hypothetical protein
MTTESLTTAAEAPSGGRPAWAPLVLVGLVIAGDYVLFGGWGINVPIFLALLGASAILLAGGAATTRTKFFAAGILLVALLPLVETASSLAGLSVALFGLGMSTVLASGLWKGSLPDLPATALGFALPAPFRLVADMIAGLSTVGTDGRWRRLLRLVVGWVLPLALGVVFLVLFAAANPLVEQGLRALSFRDAVRLDGDRIALWVFVAAFSWPFLAPLVWRPRVAEVYGPHKPREAAHVGSDFTRRSLIVFNALFAVETVLDLIYLWGGVRLPDGMTYAEYAHRGAYPLIATALLAAVFVIITMRPGGPGETDRILRVLVFAWIGQNVLLVASSLLRLDLYVDVYGLTDLRLASAAWMVLVGLGLVLILLRIMWRRSNGWLVGSNLVTLGLVLYAYAWTDTNALIARFNVDRAIAGATGSPGLDVCYLYSQPPGVIPAIDTYLTHIPESDQTRSTLLTLRAYLVSRVSAGAADWRNWSWRDARLADYLATAPGPTQQPYTDGTDVSATLSWCRD